MRRRGAEGLHRRRAQAGASKPLREKTPPPFHQLVYAVVRRIPRGKVATYGQVATFMGYPRAARAVGTALHMLPDALADRVPWQRVINSAGGCSERGGFRAEMQRERLEAEGIRFDRSGRIDRTKITWAGPTPSALRRLRRAAATNVKSQLAAVRTSSRWLPPLQRKPTAKKARP
jgi:methylated-DNA-protein-cysteine methyltransferase-like protein